MRRGNIIKNFEEKFKELRVKGYRKDGGSSSSVMYMEDRERMDEDLSNNSYTKTEMKEMESMFMRTESDARWRFQKNGPYRPR